MPINKFGEQKMMTKLQLKRLLTCILLTMLVTLNIRGQALCVIDGTPLPDSLLHVTINEMRSDSAKEIVANRLRLIPPYAIESIQIFSPEEQIKGSVLKPSCKSILLNTQFHKYLLPLHHEESPIITLHLSRCTCRLL